MQEILSSDKHSSLMNYVEFLEAWALMKQISSRFGTWQLVVYVHGIVNWITVLTVGKHLLPHLESPLSDRTPSVGRHYRWETCSLLFLNERRAQLFHSKPPHLSPPTPFHDKELQYNITSDASCHATVKSKRWNQYCTVIERGRGMTKGKKSKKRRWEKEKMIRREQEEEEKMEKEE